MIEEYLTRRLESKAFPGPMIEPVHHEFNFLFGDGGEIPLLREVLTNKAIGIFVGSPFPG